MARILIACERSGAVRDAFRRLGHEAWSCDLEQADDGSVFHIVRDARALALEPSYQWDLLVAHPPCQFLSSSGLHWNKRRPERKLKTAWALRFVRDLMAAPVPRIAIENPVGRIGTAIRPADQYIQPYQFGHDASKKTGLWLKNLPRLRPTGFVEPRYVDGLPRWGNQTDSGQNRLPPSEDRAQLRAETYRGIAQAMAEQWAPLL